MKMLGDLFIECPHCKETVQLYISRAETEQEYIDERSGLCVYCELVRPEIHTDHIIPTSKGGPNDEWNRVAACDRCNRFKGDRNPWEWLGNDWEPPARYDAQFAKAYAYLKGIEDE